MNKKLAILWLGIDLKLKCNKEKQKSDKRSYALTMFDKWFLCKIFCTLFFCCWIFFLWNENFNSFVCNINLGLVFSLVKTLIHVENMSFVSGFVSILKKKHTHTHTYKNTLGLHWITVFGVLKQNRSFVYWEMMFFFFLHFLMCICLYHTQQIIFFFVFWYELLTLDCYPLLLLLLFLSSWNFLFFLVYNTQINIV